MKGRAPASWSVLVALPLQIAACSGGDTASPTGSDGGSASTDILSLIQRSNDLARSNWGIECALCPCGAFHDVSDESERCQAEVVSAFPEVVGTYAAGLRCVIAQGETKRACLETAADCAAAEACSSSAEGGSTDCSQLEGISPDTVTEIATTLQERCNPTE